MQVAPPGDQIFVIVLKEKKCCCEEVGIVEEVTKSKNWNFLNKWKNQRNEDIQISENSKRPRGENRQRS